MRNLKSFLTLLLAFGTITTASGQPSGISDTVVLNRLDALKVLEKGLKAKIFEEQRDAYKQDLDNLTALIDIKQRQIDNLKAETKDYDKLIASYKAEIKALNEQKAIYDTQVAALSKSLKKERRKKKWATFAGIAGMAALTTLYILK